jgi:predicted GNAT family N-acyltransferase
VRVTEPSTEAEWQAYYALRWKILRAPWNQPRGSEQDDREDSSHHLMVVDDNDRVLAVGRLQFNTIREAQIRYMAVAVSAQRRGIGSWLLQALEQRARELGASVLVLDAREQALRFYRKHDYVALGPGHTLFNAVTHIQMTKTLDHQPRQPSPHGPDR